MKAIFIAVALMCFGMVSYNLKAQPPCFSQPVFDEMGTLWCPCESNEPGCKYRPDIQYYAPVEAWEKGWQLWWKRCYY